MTVKITHWFDTEEESGCSQTEIYRLVNYFTIEDQTYRNNGLWLQIWVDPESKNYNEEMRGLIFIEYDPGADEIEITNN